jgi:hypothetical protein
MLLENDQKLETIISEQNLTSEQLTKHTNDIEALEKSLEESNLRAS